MKRREQPSRTRALRAVLIGAAVGMAVSVAVPPGQMRADHTTNLAACQNVAGLLDQATPVLEDERAGQASPADAAEALGRAQDGMARIADDTSGRVSTYAHLMAADVGDLSEGYADADDDAIAVSGQAFARHAQDFLDACETLTGRRA